MAEKITDKIQQELHRTNGGAARNIISFIMRNFCINLIFMPTFKSLF